MKYAFKLTTILIWFIFNVLYPYWLVPIDPITRVITFSLGLIFFVLSSLILFKLKLSQNSYGKKETSNNHIKKLFSSNYFKIYVVVFLFCLFLSIYVANSPIIMDYGDEASHISRGIGIYKMSFGLVNNLLHYARHIAFILLILVYFIIKRHYNKILYCLKNISERIIKHKYFFVVLTSVFAISFFILLNKFITPGLLDGLNFTKSITQLSVLKDVVRFNPLSAIITALELFFFDFNELGVRVISIIFYLLGAIFVRKIISLYCNKKTAYGGGILFLLTPGIFYFSTNAHLDMGVVFFFLSSSYFFLSYIKTKNEHSLRQFCLITMIGFLYKNPLLLIYPITFIFIILYDFKLFSKLRIKEVYIKYKQFIKYYWIPLVPIIVWSLISATMRWRNYDFSITNFTNPTLLLRYFYSIPEQAGLFIFIVFIIAVGYTLSTLKTNFELKTFNLIAFAVIYLFFTGDAYSDQPIFRFSIYYLPFIIILISVFFGEFFSKIKFKRIVHAVSLIILITLAVILGLFALTVKDQAYYPVDDIFKFIKTDLEPELIQENRSIFLVRCDPIKFYLNKYNINENIIFYGRVDPKNNNTNKFYAYLKKNKVKYLVLPITEEYFFEKLRHDGITRIISKGMLNSLISFNQIKIYKVFVYHKQKLGLYSVEINKNI